MLYSEFEKINALVPTEQFKVHFSQLGEDIVVNHIFEYLFPLSKPGIYVDAGCYDPNRYSNTKLLNLRGWRGLNIDASVDSIRDFNLSRPNDINVLSGVRYEVGSLKYYKFGGTHNTFSEILMRQYVARGISFIESVDIEVNPLHVLVDRYSESLPYIDFLSVDIEGLDHAAIATFDFKKYSPRVIAIELQDLNLYSSMEHKTVLMLKNLGYELFSHTVCTSIFLKRN